MRVDQVRLGALVKCPPDRGEPGYTGKVTHVSGVTTKNVDGVDYIWVEVQRQASPHTKHVWPSNRLGKLT